jgi:hypothetical protein
LAFEVLTWFVASALVREVKEHTLQPKLVDIVA